MYIWKLSRHYAANTLSISNPIMCDIMNTVQYFGIVALSVIMQIWLVKITNHSSLYNHEIQTQPKLAGNRIFLTPFAIMHILEHAIFPFSKDMRQNTYHNCLALPHLFGKRNGQYSFKLLKSLTRYPYWH